MARKKKAKSAVKNEEVPTAKTKQPEKQAKDAKDSKVPQESPASPKDTEQEKTSCPSAYDSIAFLIVGLIVGLVIGGLIFSAMGNGDKAGEGDKTELKAPSEAEIATTGQKAVDFIATNLIYEGDTVELVEISEVGKSGVYELKINYTSGGYSQIVESYVSRDALVLCPQGIIVDEFAAMISQLEAEEEIQREVSPEETCDAMEKTSEPVLEAYVVSMCPFGTQMQRIMAEIIKEAPEAASYLKPLYIGAVVNGKVTAMHGDQEAQENLRQICLREETDKYWDYVSCYIKEGDTEGCLDEAAVDRTELEGCMNEPERGVKYAESDFALSNSYGVTGSPTLMMNGKRVSEFDFGGRTAEAAKDLLCCGFASQPAFCSTEMTTVSAAVGFSAAYSGATSTGSC